MNVNMKNLITGNKQYKVICIIHSICKEERLDPEEEDIFMVKKITKGKASRHRQKGSQ